MIRALALVLVCGGASLAEPVPLEDQTPTATGPSLLTSVFPDGLPFPFEDALAELRQAAGTENVATALIPLGRSLQRFAASPDYFASPRIVVAITGDRTAGPEAPRLADRLFLAYQPAAESIEAISYDSAAGRFTFEEIVGYSAVDATFTLADRDICLVCHQGAEPIFARPLWDETNANPAVTARIEVSGGVFHGAPVRIDVDAIGRFDAATDRAATVMLSNRLWSEGCPDAACRADLLLAALRYRLGGGSSAWRADTSPGLSAFAAQSSRRWPDGIAAIGPDILNRDPLRLGVDEASFQATGAMDPETPRDAALVWTPNDGFDVTARLIATRFTPGDIDRLDARLQGPGRAGDRITLHCPTDARSVETRFECPKLAGFIQADGSGRIDRIAIDDAEGARLPLSPSRAPRLSDGRRVALSLTGDVATLTLTDDLAGFTTRIPMSDPALGPGPFRRQTVLRLIDDVLGSADG